MVEIEENIVVRWNWLKEMCCNSRVRSGLDLPRRIAQRRAGRFSYPGDVTPPAPAPIRPLDSESVAAAAAFGPVAFGYEGINAFSFRDRVRRLLQLNQDARFKSPYACGDPNSVRKRRLLGVADLLQHPTVHTQHIGRLVPVSYISAWLFSAADRQGHVYGPG